MIDEIRLVESTIWYTEQSEKEEVYCEGWNDCNRDWMERIETVPKFGEWIPCSERLPDHGRKVLVWYKGERFYDLTEFSEYAIARHRKESGDWSGEFIDVLDVIAWMPLPEPYKESE